MSLSSDALARMISSRKDADDVISQAISLLANRRGISARVIGQIAFDKLLLALSQRDDISLLTSSLVQMQSRKKSLTSSIASSISEENEEEEEEVSDEEEEEEVSDEDPEEEEAPSGIVKANDFGSEDEDEEDEEDEEEGNVEDEEVPEGWDFGGPTLNDETMAKLLSKRPIRSKKSLEKSPFAHVEIKPSAQGTSNLAAPSSASKEVVDKTVKASYQNDSSKLEKYLKDPHFLEKFTLFLQGEFSEENIEFWLSVENFRELPEADLKSAAEIIFKEFILPGSAKELNIRHTLRTDLSEEYENGNFSPNVFDPAQHEIYHLMLTDPYPRFVKSGLYAPEQERKGTIKIVLNKLADAFGAVSVFQKTIASTTTETTQQVIQAVLSQFKLDDDKLFYSLYCQHKGKERVLGASEVPLALKLKLCPEGGEGEPLFLMKDSRTEKSKSKDIPTVSQSGKLSSRFKRGVFSSGSQRKKSKDELFAPESWVKLDLEKQAALDHHDIPLIIHLCIEAIDKRGLSTPELYRISGRSSTVKILRVELISGNPPSLDDEQYADINIITSVLKQYLQDIPKPVISTESYSEFLASLKMEQQFGKIQGFQKALSLLSLTQRSSLSAIILHLSKVIFHSVTNKSSMKDISNIFGAILMRPNGESNVEEQFQNQANIVTFLIANCHAMFRQVNSQRRLSKSSSELIRMVSKDYSAVDDITKGLIRVVVEFVSEDPVSLVAGALESSDSILERALSKLGIQGDLSRYSLAIKGEGPVPSDEYPLTVKQQYLLSGKPEPIFLVKRLLTLSKSTLNQASSLEFHQKPTQRNTPESSEKPAKMLRPRSMTFGSNITGMLKFDRSPSKSKGAGSPELEPSPTPELTRSQSSVTASAVSTSGGKKGFFARRASYSSPKMETLQSHSADSLSQKRKESGGSLSSEASSTADNSTTEIFVGESLTVKNSCGFPETLTKVGATLEDSHHSVLVKAMVAFHIQDDPDNYFLTWTPELGKDSVLLKKTDFPLHLKQTQSSLEDPVFCLKKIPSLGSRTSKREVSPQKRERSKTASSFQSIFKNPEDSDSASSYDGFLSSSPPSSPSPSPSPLPNHIEVTSLSGKSEPSRSQPKPLSKLSSIAFLASSQDSLENLVESPQPGSRLVSPTPPAAIPAEPIGEKAKAKMAIDRVPSLIRNSLSSPDLKETASEGLTIRSRANSTPWLLQTSENEDLRPITRGTIRLSLKLFNESDNYKTISVDSRETTRDIITKAIIKYGYTLSEVNYSLVMTCDGVETVMDRDEIPLVAKLRVYTSFPLQEPTFAIVPKLEEKGKKGKHAKSKLPIFSKFRSEENLRKKPSEKSPGDMLEAFLEKFSDRADKHEKISLAVELEVKGRILFEASDFPILSSDTSKTLIKNVLEASHTNDSPDHYTIFRPNGSKGEKALKASDLIGKNLSKAKGKMVFTVRQNLL